MLIVFSHFCKLQNGYAKSIPYAPHNDNAVIGKSALFDNGMTAVRGIFLHGSVSNR
jgi:hypothetical protein